MLLEQLVESLHVRLLFDSVARQNGWPTYEDWYGVARQVAQLKLAIDRILQQAHVSRDEPYTLYQLAIKLRNTWVSWRREEAYQTYEKDKADADRAKKELPADHLSETLQNFGVAELGESWNEVISGLRWLTANTKSTLSSDELQEKTIPKGGQKRSSGIVS
jgi:hypothetical protein